MGRTIFKNHLFRRPVALLLAAVTFWVGGAQAGGPTLEKLLSSPKRPSVAEVSAALAERNGQVPWGAAAAPRGAGLEHWVRLMARDVPEMIAAMEYTYPGATWGFLGRDTEALADMFEAFYQSIGQKGRVARVGMSSPTLASAQADPQLLLDFMKNLGIDVDQIASPSAPSFILVDTISKGHGRQGRAILAALYKAYQAQGHNPANLVRKLNIFGLMVSTFQGEVDLFTDSPEKLEEAEKWYATALPDDYEENHPLILYPQQPDWSNEAGYDHFTFAWHGSFGALVRDSTDHSVQAQPGPPNIVQQRQSILWMQSQILAKVAEPAFGQRVHLAALSLGYEFPLARPQSRADLKPGHFTDADLVTFRKLVEVEGITVRAQMSQRSVQRLVAALTQGLNQQVAANQLTYQQPQQVQAGQVPTLPPRTLSYYYGNSFANAFKQARAPENEVQPALVVLIEKLTEGLRLHKIVEGDIENYLPGLLNQASANQALFDALAELQKVSPAARKLLEGSGGPDPFALEDRNFRLPTFVAQYKLFQEAMSRACEASLSPKTTGDQS